MKDKQIAPVSVEPHVVLLSPVLHCVSMTALVFLRSSFGYAFLRPKSFFFAASWAFVLYAAYAWIDSATWYGHQPLLWFGVAAVFLYWFHFSVTVSREWRATGRHDNDSGTSHGMFFLRSFGRSLSSKLERRICLWMEPGGVFCVALSLRVGGERFLSAWLLFTAGCMWVKEILNRWFSIRRHKRGKNLGEDCSDEFEDQGGRTSGEEAALTSARKAGIKRKRAEQASATPNPD